MGAIEAAVPAGRDQRRFGRGEAAHASVRDRRRTSARRQEDDQRRQRRRRLRALGHGECSENHGFDGCGGGETRGSGRSLRERDERRAERLPFAVAAGIELLAQKPEGSLEARLHGLDRLAGALGDRARRQAVEVAQDHGLAHRLGKRQHRVDDAAARRLALDQRRGRGRRFGRGSRGLALAAARLAAPGLQREVARDRPQPGEERPRAIGRVG